MEIERRFLISGAIELRKYACEEIEQVYVAIRDSTEIRVRKAGKECSLAVKVGSGMKRFEGELKIPEEGYEELKKMSRWRVLKTRYKMPFNDYVMEVDVFHDTLDGLRIAEVEFASEKDALAFNPPDWVGREVTNDERYRNRSLAVNGVPR